MSDREPCLKRAYGSAHAARVENRNARFRLHVYQCDDCRKWHVANADKQNDHLGKARFKSGYRNYKLS